MNEFIVGIISGAVVTAVVAWLYFKGANRMPRKKSVTFESWSKEVDRMVKRLEDIISAFKNRDPIKTVPNSEIRSLDLIGLEILKDYVSEDSPLIKEWYINEEISNLDTQWCINYLRSNQGKLRSLQGFPDED